MSDRARRRRPKAHRGEWELTFAELFALEAVGFDPEPFASIDDAQLAWELNRDRLMQRAIERGGGDRPVAFWIFDAKRPDLLDDGDDWRTWDESKARRTAWLREHGHLTPEEIA